MTRFVLPLLLVSGAAMAQMPDSIYGVGDDNSSRDGQSSIIYWTDPTGHRRHVVSCPQGEMPYVSTGESPFDYEDGCVDAAGNKRVFEHGKP